jgi:hypothetical protein
VPRLSVLATSIPADLAAETRALAARLRSHPQPRELRRESGDLVQRLTEAGLAGYFLRPAEELGLGMVTLSTVRVGLKTAERGIAIVVRRILDRLTDEQLRRLAGVFEGLVREGGRR